MDINELQAFVSVADHGSFSKAAEQLFLTQPAISKRIAALEKNLSESLFDRIGRRVFLTEAGKVLLPHARQVLHQLADGQRAIQQLSNEVSGVLSLGTSHHIGLHHLPPILRSFHNRYPQVELDLQFLSSEDVCQRVEKGELEMGIVTLPLRPSPSLSQQVIWQDPLRVVVAPQHPLAEVRELDCKSLCDYPAILPERNTYTRELVEAALRPKHLILPVSLSTNYLETIKMMVSVGLGWSVLPLTMIDQELRIINVEELDLVRYLGVVQHRQRTLSNAALAMLAMIHEQVPPDQAGG